MMLMANSKYRTLNYENKILVILSVIRYLIEVVIELLQTIR